jgi:hypothetical protein
MQEGMFAVGVWAGLYWCGEKHIEVCAEPLTGFEIVPFSNFAFLHYMFAVLT